MSTCSVEELHELRTGNADFLLVDVRMAEELAIASVDGACHLPLDELSMRLAEIDAWKDRTVICMCHHGMRSAHAQQILQRSGFTQVRNLTGGIHAWSTRIDPGVPVY